MFKKEKDITRHTSMEKFIANSVASKKILNIAQMASGLPVNVLIVGSIGVGKKLLASYVLPDATVFDGLVLEQSIINKTINLDEYKEMIISDVEKILNKKEFMESLGAIKLVATTKFNPKEIESHFAIKIDIPDLDKRPEDLEELISIYTNEASVIYKYTLDKKDIDIDLSKNGVSLKESIYKSVLLKSLNKEDMLQSLEHYCLKAFEENQDYKDLLEIFDIAILNAAKLKYKSQVQMANHLNINRMTLRKKIDQYFIEE